MATNNELLTSQDVAREGLRLLHAKLGFVSTITKRYSSEFAQTGAKVGDKVAVRLPNRYTVRQGRRFEAQEVLERITEIRMTTQMGVDLKFSSVDLTLSLDEFSERYLEPALSVLASGIETEVFLLAQQAPTIAHVTEMTLRNTIDAKDWLDAQLAPSDRRHLQLALSHEADLKQALRTRAHPEAEISRIYRERAIRKLSGFEPFVNTLIPEQRAVTDRVNPKFNILDGADDEAHVKTRGYTRAKRQGAQLFEPGETFTLAVPPASSTGSSQVLTQVHPQTRRSLARPPRLVVRRVAERSDSVQKAFDYEFYPGLIDAGPYQNILKLRENFLTTKPLDVRPMSEVDGVTPKAHYDQSLFYQSEAFCYVSADLPLPDGVDFAARESMDGIAMRVVRDYDETEDDMITRVDVLFGMEALMPEFACRVLS